VASAFADRGLTVATAESCTSGLLVARLTERAGSSAWVLGGVASYANSAKEALVGVPSELLAEHGAVSTHVAAALAEGARARFGADVGVGITGIAGPWRRDAGQAGGHRPPVRRRSGRAPAALGGAARLALGGAAPVGVPRDAHAAAAAARRAAGVTAWSS
jgi:PncC family amidohydrolase